MTLVLCDRLPPLIHHHAGEAWLRLPLRDDAGGLVELSIALSIERLATLSADAAAALQHVLRHAHEPFTDRHHASTPMPLSDCDHSSVSTLGD